MAIAVNVTEGPQGPAVPGHAALPHHPPSAVLLDRNPVPCVRPSCSSLSPQRRGGRSLQTLSSACVHLGTLRHTWLGHRAGSAPGSGGAQTWPDRMTVIGRAWAPGTWACKAEAYVSHPPRSHR